ncbi:hypothetical protein DFH07DRAFT_892984 [Mycena maculata]|uniref:Uncharacterized protein n=1 Tax=Mycena maculata TaxID=230809 RepID=A0AAD7I9Z8_9AGAR|nr:hypothetical protein DFH07DRAFT_892984 [Mycena maculata]
MSKNAGQPLLVSAPAGVGPPQYSPHPVSYQAIYVPVRIDTQPVVCRRSPLSRFIVALLLAVGIYTILNAPRHWVHWDDRWDIPPASDMVLDQCVGVDSWAGSDAALSALDPAIPHSAGASFEIPLDSGSVLLLTRYRRTHNFGQSPLFTGTLDVTTSARLNNTAIVTVESVRSTHNGNIKACLVARNNGERGVGIFTKGVWWAGHGDATSMQIRLVLPAATTPLQLKGLIAYLPNFSLNIGKLKGAVDFKSVSLQTSNSAVHVKSLSAGEVTLHTSNGAISVDTLLAPKLSLRTSNAGISGTFNTSSSLIMTTSNAPINVRVGLESLDDATHPTTLAMRTSNHILTAKISLAAPEGAPGAFRATAKTSNGPLTLAFPTFAAGGALDLSARTSNAAAEVRLHPAYEGAFGVTTSRRYPAEVKRLHPSGDERQIEYQSGTALRGYIFSDAENKERGRVGVTTSNAPVRLFV